MRSRITKMMVAVAIVAMAIPAFAAVENIKVGADIDVTGIWRENFIDQQLSGIKETSFIYMGSRVYVAAELTDGVSAMVRLINERDFGSDIDPWFTGASIELDLAYIKVADLMTPGLDLTVGRQEIQLGDGLVVGSRYGAIDYMGFAGTQLYEIGQRKAFDAIRFDYDVIGMPMSFTGFNAKISETYGFGNDVNLWGVSMNYEDMMVSLEPYFTYVRVQHNDDLGLMNLGVRAGYEPMYGLNLTGELSQQMGKAAANQDFKGWAGLIGLNYQVEADMDPVIKAGYAIFSGQDSSSDIDQWVAVFPANIASRVGKVADPNFFAAGEGSDIWGMGSGLQVISLGGMITPVDNVSIGLDYYNLRATVTPSGVSRVYGNEVDLCLNYQYTEDLSFGLNYGIIFTGDLVEDSGFDTDNPWQLMASMNLAF